MAGHVKAIEALGTRHGIPSDAEILPGKRLICRAAIAELLALAGVLNVAAATFSLTVPTDELKSTQIEVDTSVIEIADADWTTHLIDRIREGLNQGIYELLPETPPAEDFSDREPSSEEAVLIDLMRFPASDKDVIWIDDRWASSLDRRDGMRIVGTVDLLTTLREQGAIAADDFLEILTEMRAADVRFIAFDTDELLQVLLHAAVVDGRLSETKSLRVMRQYYARCVLEADQLRPPANGTTTEWTFLMSCGHAIVTALVRVWETTPVEAAAARSEWLLRNLHLEDRGMHGTVAPRTEVDDVFRSTVALVGLVANALHLDGTGELRRARREYLSWLHRRVLQGRFATSQELVPAFVEQLKQTIARSMEQHGDVNDALAARLMRRLWSDLPNELRTLMETDQEFLRTLGISMKSVVEIGPLRMDRREFWLALILAVDVRDAFGVRRHASKHARHRLRLPLARRFPQHRQQPSRIRALG